LALVLATVLIRTAWLSDDAYITLRTVDNFVNGLGLTWNPGVRTQAYTHPLWMFLLSTLYFVTREGYYSTLFLGIGLSLATMLLFVLRIAATRSAALFGAAALILSSSYVTYSTSGLENPLTNLLIVLYFAVSLNRQPGLGKLLALTLITSLAILNRQDVALLLAPVYALSLWEQRSQVRAMPLKAVGVIILGFAPLLAWEVFSLLYYGFLFPNTYYAKLGAGAPQAELTSLGLNYLLQSARFDPVAVAVIGGALLTALWQRTARNLALALGILLYLGYVIWIGGDFMSGRFVAAPLIASLVLLCSGDLFKDWRRAAIPLSVIVALGLLSPYATLRIEQPVACAAQNVDTRGVGDERSCYYEGTGLLVQDPATSYRPSHGLAAAGLAMRADPQPVAIQGAIGMYGYHLGPDKYVVDLNGLAEPLLARLPIPPDKPWRIGHFERLIPGGYLETLAAGQNLICHSGLAEYYDRLALITRGPLLDPERLQAIWQINTGQLDHLLAAYNAVAVTDQALLCNAQAVVDVPFASGPRLRGYAISADQARPGERVVVTAYWQGKPESGTPLYSFVHIRNSQPDMPINPGSGNDIWAQAEHMEPGGRFTTDYWPPQVYADQFVLTLPPDMPPGEYFVEIGWFNPQTGEQLDPMDEAMEAPLRELWRSILLPSLTVN
jgi:arabinofuranosyltransferase